MSQYRGSCHCGAVAFDVQTEIESLIECNCSMCSRKGYLLFFAPRSSVQFSSSESKMSSYTFNKHIIKHNFCKTCGCAPINFGVDKEGNEVAAINARCIENLDLGQFAIHAFDGRSI